MKKGMLVSKLLNNLASESVICQSDIQEGIFFSFEITHKMCLFRGSGRACSLKKSLCAQTRPQ